MLLFLVTEYYRSNDPRDTPRPNAVVFFLGGKAKKKRKKKESFTAKTKPGISKFPRQHEYIHIYLFSLVYSTLVILHILYHFVTIRHEVKT